MEGDIGTATPARSVVLLVDDETGVRCLAERALLQAGWQVIAAASAEAALQILSGSSPAPDLLISDVMMPGLDGAALARQLRLVWPRLPVLLVSGYADHRMDTLLPDPTVDFLQKPYRLAQLVARAALLMAEAEVSRPVED